MKFKEYQTVKGKLVADKLIAYGMANLFGKPRSGKTPTSIVAMEHTFKNSDILVVCPPNAISGWLKFTEADSLNLTNRYTVISYGKLGTITTEFKIGKKGQKLKATERRLKLKIPINHFEGVIIDESHRVGAFPKRNINSNVLNYVCKGKAHLRVTGTHIVESPSQIYHQMQLGDSKPFKQSNFFEWFKKYGKPYSIKINGRLISQYDKCDYSKIEPIINKYSIFMTQEDAGIDSSVQAKDVLHYVELDESTIELYNTLKRDSVITLPVDGEPLLLASTVMKERTSLHMLEQGVAKIDDDYYDLPNREKIDYILDNFPKGSKIGIMCNFVEERKKVKKLIPYAEVYSATSHAEGVDLSHLEHFIILSSGYSGSKHIQRRERIINTEGSKSLNVHFILVKGAISDEVYKATSKKEDFNNRTYKRCNYL